MRKLISLFTRVFGTVGWYSCYQSAKNSQHTGVLVYNELREDPSTVLNDHQKTVSCRLLEFYWRQVKITDEDGSFTLKNQVRVSRLQIECGGVLDYIIEIENSWGLFQTYMTLKYYNFFLKKNFHDKFQVVFEQTEPICVRSNFKIILLIFVLLWLIILYFPSSFLLYNGKFGPVWLL